MYRLICKDTIEEKILQRAKQKNAVQELVMKGKHVQDDHLMRQEDVVSLLLDDTQIAHKLKEISMQVTLQYHFHFFGHLSDTLSPYPNNMHFTMSVFELVAIAMMWHIVVHVMESNVFMASLCRDTY